MTITTEGNDFQLTESLPVDIEAAAEGRKPYIQTAPAYSGGMLDVAWMYNGERLPTCFRR